MSALKVSPDLAVPLDVASQAVAILGIRGAGKTNTGAVFAEELLTQHQPIVVIDPTDAWWGLRSGFPVFIFRGTHGDLPLDETDGKVIARFLVDEQVPVILSLRHLRKNAQRRFVTEFCEEIYHLKGKPENRTPLTVFIDEAPLFVPQKVMGETARTVGAVEDLIARGRNAGFGVVLISQRSATLNKDVLTQCDTIITHRLTSPQDRKALSDWIEENATISEQKEVLASLAKLPNGGAWVWGPSLDVFKQVQIRMRKTFDSSATPKRGEQPKQPKDLTSVDLEKLKGKLSASIEKAKADDPKVLRAEISRLKGQADILASAAVKPAAPDVAARDALKAAKAIADGVRRELDLVVERVATAMGELQSKATTWTDRLTACQQRLDGTLSPAAESVDLWRKAYEPRSVVAAPEHKQAQRELSRRVSRAVENIAAGADATLGKAERAILTVLVQCDGAAKKVKLAAIAGYTHNGGGFNNALGALRSKEYITRGEPIELTHDGRQAIGDVDPLPTGARNLVAHWQGRLSKAEASILGVVFMGPTTKEEIASATGYEPTGGGFNNALGRLRTLELITRGTPIALNPEVFS